MRRYTKTAPPKDHPRSRGEYCRANHRFRSGFGSSPLSRGILAAVVADGLGGRIIPALAGNTQRCAVRPSSRGDHPRSRGEYAGRRSAAHSPKGSSPLSRGIPRTSRVHILRRGIIPALAGNTQHQTGLHPTLPDHPRSRGEYDAAARLQAEGAGSSPLSRGIRSSAQSLILTAGIIPALAGNTPRWRRHRPARSDHPRSRGEYALALDDYRRVSGSSPLSRGILFETNREDMYPRIIPALAGNTRREKSQQAL